MPRDESQSLSTSDAGGHAPEELYAPSPVETFSEHARADSTSGIREGVRRSKLAPGRVVAGRFEIVRVLRHGGMGTVCLVHHRFLGQPMALKVVFPGTGAGSEHHVESDVDAARERLANEGRIAARVRHPNVVTIHDAGVDSELGPYVAMELLEGQTLRDWMSERRDAETCLEVLEGLLEGAMAVHACGLVHRDLTPENVFVHRDGDRVQVKLLDFGLASDARPAHVGPQLTRPGDALGKPHYRAPEQLRDPTGPCDARADVWSLGVIAHELLTGRLPVLEESTEDGRVVTRRHAVDASELGGGLSRLIASCVADDPARRPADARALLRDLRRLRRGTARRPRWTLAAAMTVLSLVGLGALAATWSRDFADPNDTVPPDFASTTRIDGNGSVTSSAVAPPTATMAETTPSSSARVPDASIADPSAERNAPPTPRETSTPTPAAASESRPTDARRPTTRRRATNRRPLAPR